jgi:hypothetical protein
VLEILEGAYGILEVGRYRVLDLVLDAPANQQKAGNRQSRGNEEHGEKKLGSEPKFQHEFTPSSRVLAQRGMPPYGTNL